VSTVVPVLDLPVTHPLFSAGSKLLAALAPYSYDGGGWFVTADSDSEFIVGARVPEPGYPGEFQGVHELFVLASLPLADQVAAVRAFYGI
jgi:hypothetical protein